MLRAPVRLIYALEYRNAFRVRLDLREVVVQPDRVALELEVGQAQRLVG